MTASAPPPPSRFREPVSSVGCPEGEIIDADFLVLDPVPRPVLAVPFPQKAVPHSGGMAALQADLAPSRPFGRRGGWGFWLSGLSLVASAFWVSGGHALFLSVAAASAPLPPLTLALLTSGTETLGGRSVLHVEAEARNGSGRARALPALSILVTTGKGAAMRYNLDPPPDGIGPNGRQRFSTRLPLPADGVSAVRIAFAQ